MCNVSLTTDFATPAERRALKLGPTAEVVRAVRKCVEGSSIAYELVTVPRRLVPTSQSVNATTDIMQIAVENSLQLGLAKERVRPVKAGTAVGVALGVPANRWVFRIEQTVWLLNGPPFAWRVVYRRNLR